MSFLSESNKLLRLYQVWPQRGQYDSIVDESDAFFGWLSREQGSQPLVRKLKGADEIQKFLELNGHLIGANTAGRKEQRFTANIATLVSPLGETLPANVASHCQAIDVGLHGIRLISDSYLLDIPKVLLNLAPASFPISIYRLEGETVWTGSSDEGFLIGVKLIETEDFERWCADFETRFGATLK